MTVLCCSVFGSQTSYKPLDCKMDFTDSTQTSLGLLVIEAQSLSVHYVILHQDFPMAIYQTISEILKLKCFLRLQTILTLQAATVPSLAMRSDTQQRCIIPSSRMQVRRLCYKLTVSPNTRSNT